VSTGWGGADPVSVVDLSTYDLGVKYRANLSDIIISDLRIFGGDSGVLGGRQAHLFTLAGGTLAALALPNTMTPGWATYALGAPVQINAGSTFWVAYDTTGSYGFLANAPYPVNSADGLVTAIGAGFNTNVDQMPNQDTNSFYGLDFVYSLVGGNTRPVAGLVAQPTTPRTAQATVTIDDESPGTCNVVIEWGDGTSSSRTGPGSLSHTYAVAGTYAVLVTVTDGGGLTDSAAVPVTVLNATDTYELEVQRQLTAGFIAADPFIVNFTRYPRIANGSGGYAKGAPVAVATQAMKLIRLGDTAVERTTEDGRSVAPTFVLVASWDADIQRWDEFTMNGHRLQVVYVDNRGYEAKAEVIYLG
jgi:PKD repeat protein